MSAPRLRCVTDEMLENIPQAQEPNTVCVSVSDVMPLFLDAALSSRVWLEDFGDESMEISEDLYEVLLAYHRIAAGSKRAA